MKRLPPDAALSRPFLEARSESFAPKGNRLAPRFPITETMAQSSRDALLLV